MQTILALTDFSAVASHAAAYAANLARHFHSDRLILLNVYPTTTVAVGVPVIPEMPVIETNTDEFRQKSIEMLEEQRNSLKPLTDINTVIDTRAEVEALEEVVNTLAQEENVDLVVMGITGKSNLEKIIVGSSTIRVLEHTKVPLVIVPATADIAIPEKILLAVDFDNVREGEALPSAVLLIDRLRPELFVVNVTKGEGYSVATEQDIRYLHQLLEGYNTSFHYLENKEVADAITSFAQQHNISMIMAAHHKRSGIASWFHKSVSKKLAWHCEVPLLILPD
ncbi:MAG TPA: universal stress protein [Chitinophaga sp.]|nr:universal stress protein [Chitinophaga sp.]